MPRKKERFKYRTNFSELLGAFLKKNKISNRTMASEIGVTESCIRKIVSEQREPNLVNSLLLMASCGIEFDEIEIIQTKKKKEKDVDPRQMLFPMEAGSV